MDHGPKSQPSGTTLTTSATQNRIASAPRPLVVIVANASGDFKAAISGSAGQGDIRVH